MALARSIDTRLEEAVYLVLSQDPDLFAHWGGSVGGGSYAEPDVQARCYIGPTVVDPLAVSAPQGHIAAVLPPPLEDGVGGVTTGRHIVRVSLIEDMDEPTRTTGGNRPIDWLHHAVKLIKAEGENLGRLDDPDNPGEKINDRVAERSMTSEIDEAARYVAFHVDLEFEAFENIQGELA